MLSLISVAPCCLTASGMNRSTRAASSCSLHFVCLTVLGFCPSLINIIRGDAITFFVSKTIVSAWRSSSSWFRTQALGQSNFLLSLFGLFLIFNSL